MFFLVLNPRERGLDLYRFPALAGEILLQVAVLTHAKDHFSVPTRAPQVAFAPRSRPVLRLLIAREYHLQPNDVV